MMAKASQFQFPDTTKSPVPRGPIPYPTSKSYLILKCSMQGCNKSPTCTLPKTNAMVCTDCYKKQTGGYPLPSSKMSTGDEAGTAGGAVSSVMMGPARNISNKVIFDGTLKGSLMNQHHGLFITPSQTKVKVTP